MHTTHEKDNVIRVVLVEGRKGTFAGSLVHFLIETRKKSLPIIFMEALKLLLEFFVFYGSCFNIFEIISSDLAKEELNLKVNDPSIISIQKC